MITPKEVKAKTPKRFWEKIKFAEPNECWIWTAALIGRGYGYYNIGNGVMRYAHRLTYEMLFNSFDANLKVCHSCDNPSCVNPNHLWQGTQGDNLRDMDKKGRRVQGSTHGCSKLTEALVREIIRRTDAGEVQQVIADELNVIQSTISKIKLRYRWKHLQV